MIDTQVNSFVEAYVDANLRLVKTLTIKSSISASLMQSSITGQDATTLDLSDRASWKYYRHLAGVYDPSDMLMTVTSLDTLEPVVFEKNALQEHPVTLKNYGYGSRYYNDLVDRFPNQESLILGTLYPADIDEAIAAEDGNILAYPAELVEPQELTLIEELEGFIKRLHYRWNVAAYGNSENLYGASFFGVMLMQVVPKLLNLRLARCKTHEAHSFHIQQYLASHQGLDAYVRFMTLEQKLWLYRNVLYLERNVGKTQVFNTLVEKLFTLRSLPMTQYSMRQLTSADTDHWNKVIARQSALNPQINSAEKTDSSVSALLVKEGVLAPGNPEYIADREDAIVRAFKTASSSVVQTKDLECNVVDYTNAVPDTFVEVLLSHWGAQSLSGVYRATVTFKPLRSTESKQLSVADAFIYHTFLALRALKLDPMPAMRDVLIRKARLPTLPAMSALVGRTPLALVNRMRVRYQDFLNHQVRIQRLSSASAFFKQTTQIYRTLLDAWHWVSNTHDPDEQAVTQMAVLSCYETRNYALLDQSVDIPAWLEARGLADPGEDSAAALQTMVALFEQCTGYAVSSEIRLKHVLRAMADIFRHLSSYSVQLIETINDADIMLTMWKAIGARYTEGFGKGNAKPLSHVSVQDTDLKSSSTYTIDVFDFTLERTTGTDPLFYITQPNVIMQVVSNVGAELYETTSESHLVDTPMAMVKAADNVFTVVGLTDEFYSPMLTGNYTAEQIAGFKSIY